MRSQPALRAALREAVTVGRGRASVRSLNTTTASFCSPAAACLHNATARPRMPTTISAKIATPARTCLFSTSAARTASAPPASSAEPAPVLAPSVLAQLLQPSAASGPAALANRHPSVYATVLIHGRPYLVTPGDSVRLPFRMPGVQAGDELRLDRVGVVGSRAVTAVSHAADTSATPPRLGEVHVPGASVRAVVLGVETEPLRTMVKKKRRTRRHRTVKSKHRFTVLRIQEIMLETAP